MIYIDCIGLAINPFLGWIAIDPFMGRARARARARAHPPAPCARPFLRSPRTDGPPATRTDGPAAPADGGGWARARARPMKGSIAIQPKKGGNLIYV